MVPSSSANRLIHEHSPYLLQHAHNPVDWYPWCDEAFEKARREDLPVLVSIGYSACHWCHVMERESFEDEAVAAFMNEHFVNIKVDREERPDIDHIYMDAVQVMTGSGGWPLNVFLTPDGRPFYGGTYFPPERVFNRPSWKEILLGITESYRERKADVTKQAENLTEHLRQFNSPDAAGSRSSDLFSEEKLHEALANIMRSADTKWGGFGRAPKFPQTFTIEFLFQYARLYDNEEARTQALLSLDKMIEGGIYDQAGGGFARYATDTEWLVPHFEKMLYDNALLVGNLASAYQLTGIQRYKEVIAETLAFVEREMMHPEGGFYSALDADSEGEEGKYYVWDYEEVTQLLGEDAGVFCTYYNITPQGNWEGKNILRVLEPAGAFAAKQGIPELRLNQVLEEGRRKLHEKRAFRVRPGLDDKVLLGWNALMNRAYSRAFAATGNLHYKEMAVSNMRFLLNAFDAGNQSLMHSWKNGKTKYPAFLDDYACLIAALIELAQVTADFSWLDKAALYTEKVLADFGDGEAPLFYYTAESQTDVILRKKEIYDSATPSGNSVMAANLYYLSILLNKAHYRSRTERMLIAVGDLLIKYPTSFNGWLSLLSEILAGTYEIAVVGTSYAAWLQEILKWYLPNKLVMAATGPDQRYPLLADKPSAAKTLVYVCRNYACDQPEDSLSTLYNRLKVKYF